MLSFLHFHISEFEQAWHLSLHTTRKPVTKALLHPPDVQMHKSLSTLSLKSWRLMAKGGIQIGLLCHEYLPHRPRWLEGSSPQGRIRGLISATEEHPLNTGNLNACWPNTDGPESSGKRWTWKKANLPRLWGRHRDRERVGRWVGWRNLKKAMILYILQLASGHST